MRRIFFVVWIKLFLFILLLGFLFFLSVLIKLRDLLKVGRNLLGFRWNCEGFGLLVVCKGIGKREGTGKCRIVLALLLILLAHWTRCIAKPCRKEGIDWCQKGRNHQLQLAIFASFSCRGDNCRMDCLDSTRRCFW